MQTILISLLSVIASLSALLSILGKYASGQILVYIFKPLTTILILAIAVIAGLDLSANFKFLLYIALLCSLLGDIFLMLPDKFIQGLISFFLAHALFLLAFLLLGTGFHAWLLLIFTTVALVAYTALLPHLGKMKLPVLLYIVLISAMAWRAWENWYLLNNTGTLLIALGALIFLISDTCFAFNKFRKKFKAGEAIILSTYFAAIWLFAISLEFM